MMYLFSALFLALFGWIAFGIHYDPETDSVRDPRNDELLTWGRAPVFWILAFAIFQAYTRVRSVYRKVRRN